MSPSALYAQAFIDRSTGLPNGLYFQLIREWEERRARRRGRVCVLTVRFRGGAPEQRRSLAWRLRCELRENDLVATEGPSTFYILLASPDAECASHVLARVHALAGQMNARRAEGEPLEVEVGMEEVIARGEEETRET